VKRWAAALAARWSEQAWRPERGLWTHGLAPLALAYEILERRQRRQARPTAVPVPVVVVGNWVVGGAGKTPTVIALVQALVARGIRPGVVSRGYGRDHDGVQAVDVESPTHEVGDEPLLIRRRTGVPLFVGRDRPAAVRALCAAHPQCDVVVADDGLQHHALPRAAEVWVFDDRGIGNGALLPAGPLRAPLPATVPAHARVLYTGARQSTPLPGVLAQATVQTVLPLADWWAGRHDRAQALPAFAARVQAPCVAVAGIAAPQKFFAMLEAAGLPFERCPQPDHADYRAALPWPAQTADVIVTEKDAIKLAPERIGATRVWVAPLDFALPEPWADEIAALLRPLAKPAANLTPPWTTA
jgi:tetraacyldisaccharide 4'-kinase